VLLCALLCASTVRAQSAPIVESADYQRVVRDALQEYHLTNFAEAYALFEQAHQLQPSARTWRCLGMTSFELRQYVRSEIELKAALADTRQPLTAAQHSEVIGLLDRVAHYVGKVAIHTKPSAASIALDGQSVPMHGQNEPLTVNLGDHELVVRADGYQTAVRKLSVEGGKAQSVEIELTAVSAAAEIAPPPSEVARRAAPPAQPLVRVDSAPQPEPLLVERWWFWTALGVVAVGSVVAAVVLSTQPDKPKPEPGDVVPVIMTLSGPSTARFSSGAQP
jgi:hypothetical protein